SVFISLLICGLLFFFFFFSSRRRHTRSKRDWSSDVCSSDLKYMSWPCWFVLSNLYIYQSFDSSYCSPLHTFLSDFLFFPCCFIFSCSLLLMLLSLSCVPYLLLLPM